MKPWFLRNESWPALRGAWSECPTRWRMVSDTAVIPVLILAPGISAPSITLAVVGWVYALTTHLREYWEARAFGMEEGARPWRDAVSAHMATLQERF